LAQQGGELRVVSGARQAMGLEGNSPIVSLPSR